LAAANSKAALLHELFGIYWQREQKIRGPAVKDGFKNRQDFELCFELLALTAWRKGDTRALTAAEARSALAKTPFADRLLPDGERDDALPAFLSGFFFSDARFKDGHGVEFTHKSFAEFLYVRHLVRFWRDILHRRPTNFGGSLRDWHAITGAQPISFPIHILLNGEIARPRAGNADDPAFNLQEAHEFLNPLITQALRDGIASEFQSCSARIIARTSVNAEEALLAVFHACWSNTEGQKEASTWAVDWGGDRGFARLLGRLADASSLFPGGTNEHAQEVDFRCLYAHLNAVNLVNADLLGANLLAASLFGADFNNADIRGSILVMADLSGANLRHANLEDANLSGANIRNADLRDANLEDAILRDANLSAADIRNANLTDANLNGADLRNADLTDANLKRTDPRGVKNLMEAIWDEHTQWPDGFDPQR